jgi:hypothetical protein
MAARAYAGELFSSRSVSLAVGRRIVNDGVVGRESPERPFLAGETVYAHSKISGRAFIEHVWTRDGLEVMRQVIPVGAGRCWRTWSYHVLEAGDYTVEVFGPDGKRLAWRAFTAS